MSKPSAIAAISPAIDHTDETLFKSFDLNRWFILGFLTFVQTLVGGSQISVNYPNDIPEETTQILNRVYQWIIGNLTASAIIGGGITFLAIAIFLLLNWLSARGAFAYLDCIVNRKAEVTKPWVDNALEADSFFLFRVIFNLVFVVLIFCELAPVAVTAFGMSQAGGLSTSALLFATSSVICLALFITTVLLFFLLSSVLIDFVLPIQFMRRISCSEALKTVWNLIKSNPVVFLIYWVMKVIIGFVFSIITFIVCCLTCCCAALPVVGQTILQPLFVFNRSYPLFLLKQFGPEFDPFDQNVHAGEVAIEHSTPDGSTFNDIQSPIIDADPLPPGPPESKTGISD